ncbi:MAG: hypothetical protein LBF34_04250 [Puniceicoccales bacterium]|jgi:hypothetical protein|nr:hypothetical protein [Puniceicoccales bacterium]
MAQITNKSSKIFINRFIAGTLLLGSSAIIATEVQVTSPLPNQEQDISNDKRKDLLDLRALLFQQSTGSKEALKESCRQLIRNKGIDLNTPICFITLLEGAILRCLEDTAEILIELSSEIKIPLGRKKGIGKKDGPSLLHIVTYSPKIMNEAWSFVRSARWSKIQKFLISMSKLGQTILDVPMHRKES